MKILILSPLFPPNYAGGAEVAAYELGRWLVGQGHQVGVLTTAPDDRPEQEDVPEEGMRVWRLHFPRPYYLREHCRFTGLKKALWHLQDQGDRRNREIASRVVDAFGPEVVNIHGLQALGHNIPLALARRDLPVVYTLHDYSVACVRTSLHAGGRRCEALHGTCALTQRWKRHCLGRLRRLAFHAPSAAVYRSLDRVMAPYPVRREVIPHPMSFPGSPTRRERPACPHFLYVGRLHATKGVEVLLRAAQRLRATHSFRVTVVGDGPEGEKLRAEFGGEPWVRFAGFVPNVEVEGYMRAADILCVPSVWEEPFGLVAYQAITLGLPVLASRSGAIPELVADGENGLLLPPGDVEAWSRALRAVCDDPGQLARLGAGAAARARDYDQDVLGRRVVELFSSTIRGV